MTREWTRRFLSAPERLTEMLELYRSMGLEVRTEKPSAEELGEQCTGCVESGCGSSMVIYTRPLERKQ